MMSLSDYKQADFIDAINTASRYLNDRIYTFVQLMPNKNDHFANRFMFGRCLMPLLELIVCLFCCFTSQSTAIVITGRSVHLTTLFPWQA